jgi:hypothetical protein
VCGSALSLALEGAGWGSFNDAFSECLRLARLTRPVLSQMRAHEKERKSERGKQRASERAGAEIAATFLLPQFKGIPFPQE